MNIRIGWLMQLVEQITPLFEKIGYQIPVVKVSVG